MAISKASVAAGLLGGGGGAAGTVAIVKYATSKETSVDLELQKARQDVLSWAGKTDRECSIRIKTNESKISKALDQFDNKDVLKELFKFLENSQHNSDAINKCKKGKTLVATKGTTENSWTFKDWVQEVDEINEWTSQEGRNCVIKVVVSSTETDLDQVNSSEDLKGLSGFLKGNSSGDAKQKCTDGSNLKATKGNDSNSWTFTK